MSVLSSEPEITRMLYWHYCWVKCGSGLLLSFSISPSTLGTLTAMAVTDKDLRQRGTTCSEFGMTLGNKMP